MAEPRYIYDPATQTYTPVDPTTMKPVNQGLGALYDAGGGDGTSTPGAPNLGTLSPMATEMGVAAQNLGNAINTNPMSSFSPTLGVVGALSSTIGNSIMGTEVSPVAAPVAPQESAIAPTMGLAAMNAQQEAENEAQNQQAAVATTATAVADAVSEGATVGVGSEAGHAADGNNSGDGGGGTGADGTAGVGSEAGHAADGNNASDGPAGGEGEKAGGPIYLKRYNQGGVASLANKVQSQGRGQDKMLVHMTPKEVAGLQYLAMAHGGSLTINPKTGLVEAGFLSSILPMVAGAALNAAVPGLGMAMGGFAIPALVGGASYLMNPKQGLMGGLMAGLGAYGGMNLSNALITPESIGAQNMAAQGGYDELIRGGFMDQSGQL